MGMVQRRRRRDLSTLDGLVRAGRLQVVNPTTDTGWRSYGAGGRLFLPAATNYATNPSFETDTDADGLADGWEKYNPTGTSVPTASAAAPLTGSRHSRAQRVTCVGVAGDANVLRGINSASTAVGSFAPGEVATASALVLAPTVSGGTLRLYISAFAAGDTFIADTANLTITPSAEVSRISLTTQALPANTSRVRLYLIMDGVSEGDALDLTIDDVLIEKSPFPTPYFDGNTHDCAWTGTPNASTSTRTKSVLVDTVASGWLNTAATIAIRFTPLFASTNTAAFKLFTFRDLAGTANTLGLDYNNMNWRVLATGTGTDILSSGALSFAAGSTHHLVMRSTQGGAGTLDLNHDGTSVTQIEQTKTLAGGTALAIGNYVGDYQAAGYLGPAIVSPTRKSDSWVTAIQANSGAAYSDPLRLWRDFMSAGDLLIPLQGDSRAYRKVA